MLSKRHSLRVRAIGFAVFLLLASGTQQLAAEPILDISGGTTGFPALVAGTFGWEFTVTSSISVNGLGYWDEADHTLFESHEIGLWSVPSGTLLASAVVTSASTPTASSSGEGQWLFIDIPSVTLQDGVYVIGATEPLDDMDVFRQETGISTIPGITWDTAILHRGNGLAYPQEVDTVPDSAFGPNLLADNSTSIATPEPPSLLLEVIAALGTLLSSLRLSRRR